MPSTHLGNALLAHVVKPDCPIAGRVMAAGCCGYVAEGRGERVRLKRTVVRVGKKKTKKYWTPYDTADMKMVSS